LGTVGDDGGGGVMVMGGDCGGWVMAVGDEGAEGDAGIMFAGAVADLGPQTIKEGLLVGKLNLLPFPSRGSNRGS